MSTRRRKDKVGAEFVWRMEAILDVYAEDNGQRITEREVSRGDKLRVGNSLLILKVGR
jgi:hypothetical protein